MNGGGRARRADPHRPPPTRAAALGFTLAVAFAAIAGGAAAADSGLPPDIAEIQRRLEAGSPPSAEDLRKLEAFARSQAASAGARSSPPAPVPMDLELPPSKKVAPPDGGRACHCIDLNAVRRRIEEARVAIGVYRTALNATPAGTPFTADGYAKVQAAVQATLDGHTYDAPPAGPPLGHAPGGHGPAATDPFCSTSMTPTANACERRALDRHESVHRIRCSEKKGWNPLADPFRGMTLADVLKEEIEAYDAERTFLLLVASWLRDACFVWSGTIDYESVDRREGAATEPVATADGSKTTKRHFEKRITASVRLNDVRDHDEAPATVGFALLSTEQSDGAGTVTCRVRGKYADRPVSWHGYQSTAGEATHTADARVGVHLFDDGRYDLRFSAAVPRATLRTVRKASRTGGCDGDGSRPVDESGTADAGGGRVEAVASGTVDRRKLDPEIGGTAKETVGSETTTVTWRLKRHLARDAP